MHAYLPFFPSAVAGGDAVHDPNTQPDRPSGGDVGSGSASKYSWDDPVGSYLFERMFIGRLREDVSLTRMSEVDQNHNLRNPTASKRKRWAGITYPGVRYRYRGTVLTR